MATLSVKLAESTKKKLQRLAKTKGVTSHALMVSAIETALEKSEQQSSFMQQALSARKKTRQSGQAFDGAALSVYLKAKVQGLKAKRPAPIKLTSIKSVQT